MGVDPHALSEGRVGRSRETEVGFERGGFERNGVDRITEGDRTSTPWTFFVIFVGGSVGLGAVAFGWVGLTFGLGLWATISAIAVGTAVGVALLVPLVLIGSRTATNNATGATTEISPGNREPDANEHTNTVAEDDVLVADDED